MKLEINIMTVLITLITLSLVQAHYMRSSVYLIICPNYYVACKLVYETISGNQRGLPYMLYLKGIPGHPL